MLVMRMKFSFEFAQLSVAMPQPIKYIKYELPNKKFFNLQRDLYGVFVLNT